MARPTGKLSKDMEGITISASFKSLMVVPTIAVHPGISRERKPQHLLLGSPYFNNLQPISEGTNLVILPVASVSIPIMLLGT